MRFPKLVKNIASVAIIGAVLTGCSSFSPKNSYKSDPKSSVALNVVNASGLNESKALTDVTQEDLRKSAKGNSSSSTLGLDVASASLFATGTATALPGLSSLGSAGLMLVPSLLPSKTAPYQHSRWIVWMPKDDDLTPEQAKMKLRSIFAASTKQVFPSHGFSEYQRFARHKTNSDDVQFLINDPVESTAPDWLGGYQAYSWGIFNDTPSNNRKGVANIIFPKTVSTNYRKDMAPLRSDILSINKHTPSWMFYYSSADFFHGYENAEYPVVINQGKAHFFIEPAQAGQDSIES